MSKLSVSEKKTVLALYNQGTSAGQLADKYGISQATIYLWAKQEREAKLNQFTPVSDKSAAPPDIITLPTKRKDIWDLLDEYFNVLQMSKLSDKSIEDYYYFAECFVRWADGDFTPGGNL